MAMKVVKAKSSEEAKPKKKLKVVATEPEVDPEEPDEAEEEKPAKKAKAEKPKKTAEKALSTSKVEAVVVDSVSLLTEARVAYKAFQVSWFDFAKKLKEIRDAEAWHASGQEDFTSLCREEFPDIPASTISKFIKVVEEFGPAMEARVKGLKALPSYDALYEVAVNEKKIPKEDSMRLRKAVVDCKISVREVREVVRGLVSKKPTKHAESREEKKKVRREEIGLKTEDAEASDEDVEVDEKEEITSSIDKNADALLKLVRKLISDIPAITSSMKEGTAKLIELAEAMEELHVQNNEFLDKLETVSNS